MDKVSVGRITNTAEQIQFLSKLTQMNNFSLVVIDNVSDLFSFEYSKKEQTLEKNSSFMKYMHDLSLIAIQKKIPIVVTNIVRKIGDSELENLEKSISMFTHLKIKLIKNGNAYVGEILPSYVRKRKFSYLITSEGLTESS